MPTTQRTVALHAVIVGHAWGGFDASLPLDAALPRHTAAPVELADLLRRNGGDFQRAAFCPDESVLVFRRERFSNGRRTVHERVRMLREFPSLAGVLS